MGSYRVNLNFGGMRRGDLIEIDPDRWQPQIEQGWLTPTDDPEHGADPDEQSPDVPGGLVPTVTTSSTSAAPASYDELLDWPVDRIREFIAAITEPSARYAIAKSLLVRERDGLGRTTLLQYLERAVEETLTSGPEPEA